MNIATIIFSLILLVYCGASDDFKNLQGPPDEFPDFVPANAEESASITQGSFTDIILQGSSGSVIFVVDSTSMFSFCLVSPISSELEFTFQLPGETNSITLEQLISRFNGISYQNSLGVGIGAMYPTQCNELYAPTLGVYNVTVFYTSNYTTRQLNPQAVGYFITYNQSPLQLKAYNSLNRISGQTIQILGELLDSSTGRRIVKDVDQSEAYVTLPDGTEVVISMKDDGMHGDGAANDGIYGGLVTTKIPGTYVVSTYVFDVDDNSGGVFERSVEKFFVIIDSNLDIASTASATMKTPTTIEFQIPFVGSQTGANGYVGYAEVWGKERFTGINIPIAWVSGINMPNQERDGSNFLPLDLNINWVLNAGATPPYSLRNVRIQDRSTLTILSSVSFLPVNFQGNFPFDMFNHTKRSTEITEEMRSGPRPPRFTKKSTVGGLKKKILVHGYCSGAEAWPTEDFTDYIVFLDPNQSRDLDTFASLIKQFGENSNLESYSIIAHSQGGLAALHLASYYWSGLDVASGGLLIQSVGSPYQGTAIAGSLASIGKLFGYGCGSNPSLTKDGAGAWLAGIPAEKQALVHYYTTQGKDQACSSVCDFFGLDKPNDGVTSRDFAQLPSGNNEGHVSGWCHTVSMTETFQNFDHTRNSKINTLAAL